jgi:NifU-like protein
MAQALPYSAKVADHLQNPRHLGLLSEKHANGGTERVFFADAGPTPRGDTLRLSIKLRKSDETIVDAGFQNSGSRLPIPSASCLCSLIVGKTLTQALKLKVHDLHRELDGLPEKLVRQPVLVLEAFNAIAREARGLPPLPKPDPNEPLLCVCFRVPASVIERAVRLRGLKTVAEVTEATNACGGCQTCRPEIEELLERCARGEYTVNITPAEYEEARQQNGTPRPSSEDSH